MSAAGKWGYSTDEELYHGRFDTEGEAKEAAGDDCEAGQLVWIGQYRDPAQPDDVCDATDLFERVWCHEDYTGEWAEGAFEPSKNQAADLEERIHKVYAEWLDEHDLRPDFGVVERTIEYRVPDVSNEGG